MKIGMIGAGNIGATAARLFAEAGHEVALSNTRGPRTLEGLVNGMGSNARPTTIEEAANLGEVVMEAIPYGRYTELPTDALSGKIFITASNYYPGRDGEMDLYGRAQSELVAEHLTGARVVKAFNTIYYRRLAENGRPASPLEERETIFVARNSPSRRPPSSVTWPTHTANSAPTPGARPSARRSRRALFLPGTSLARSNLKQGISQ